MRSAINIKLLSILHICNAAATEYDPFWDNLMRLSSFAQIFDFNIILILKQIFGRGLTQTQETLTNSPNCGKRLETKSRKVIRQLEQDQCLSSCQKWKPNPLFKLDQSKDFSGQSHYWTRWHEPFNSAQNTFPLLHDAPLIPEDLNCVKGCFDVFRKDSVLLRRIQRECSASGFDRQIPTHFMEGHDHANSDFSFHQYPSLPLPLNPNLDCLLYYEMSERHGCRCSTCGVCNFIADQVHQGANKPRLNSGKTKQISSFITNITDPDDYRNFILRASSPVARAIALCAQAKINIVIGDYSDNRDYSDYGDYSAKVNNFGGKQSLSSSDSEQTCDSFMPDVFGSLCSCVGSCGPSYFDPTNDTHSNSNANLILRFHTDRGLWGCQDACKRTVGCEFYTHSKLSYFEGQTKYAEIPTSPVFHCFLWRKCDTFFIPNTSVGQWLDLRSGPKDCSLYTQKCPIVKSVLGILESLPTGYTLDPSCLEGNISCGFEVIDCHEMLSSCTLTLILPCDTRETPHHGL